MTNNKDISFWMTKNIFMFLALIYILKMFINFVPIYLCILLWCMVLLTVNIKQVSKMMCKKRNTIFLLYLVICVVSFGTINSDSYSLANYLYGIKNIVIPMMLYFVGIHISGYSEDKFRDIIKSWHFAFYFAIILGLVLNYLYPAFYHSHIRNQILLAYGSDIDLYYGGRSPRLYGIFLSSQAAGIFSAVAPCLTLYLYKDSNRKWFYILIAAVSSFLSKQRAAWVVFAGVILVYLLSEAKKVIFYKKAIAMLGIIITLFVFFYSDFIGMIQSISNSGIGEMAKSIKGILRDRFDFPGPQRAIRDFKEHFMIGNGLAYQYWLDANYHRILADVGLIGVIPFLALLVKFGKAILKNRDIFFLAGIAVGILINALGEPMLDSIFPGGLLFWMLLGLFINYNSTKCNN